jgi:hypothetical protein
MSPQNTKPTTLPFGVACCNTCSQGVFEEFPTHSAVVKSTRGSPDELTSWDFPEWQEFK